MYVLQDEAEHKEHEKRTNIEEKFMQFTTNVIKEERNTKKEE